MRCVFTCARAHIVKSEHFYYESPLHLFEMYGISDFVVRVVS